MAAIQPLYQLCPLRFPALLLMWKRALNSQSCEWLPDHSQWELLRLAKVPDIQSQWHLLAGGKTDKALCPLYSLYMLEPNNCNELNN